MKYLLCFGGVYRLTKDKYRQYLRQVSEGKSPDLGDYGTYLGDVVNVTDITSEQALDLLLVKGAK